MAVLTAMATERAALYEDVADTVIDIDGVPAERIADRVLDCERHTSPLARSDLD